MRARTFVFQDAKSHKFWSVAVEGDQLVTRWGRVGTEGQDKVKAFADAGAAELAAGKLIAEKVRKGYVEDGTGGLPRAAVIDASAPGPRTPRDLAPEPARQPAAPAAGERPALDLAPHEWSIATWRPLHEVPEGLPDAFELARATGELKRYVADSSAWWTHWVRSPIRPLMTREEAAFWLHLSQPGRWRQGTVLERARELGAGPIDVPSPDVAFVMALGSLLPDGEALGALVHLMDPADIADWFTRPVMNYDPDQLSHGGRGTVAIGVRAHLLPRLDQADRDRLTDHVRTEVGRQLAATTDNVYSAEILLAAQLGLHEEIEDVVSRWPDGWNGHTEVLFGLRSADAVRAAVERLQTTLNSERDIVAWLAHTELDDLTIVERSAVAKENREWAERFLSTFAERVHAPAAAETMAVLIGTSRAPAVAKAWLDEHPAEAVAGLAPALGRQGQRAEAATSQLQRLARSAHRETFDAAVAELGPAEAKVVRTKVLDVLGDDLAELETTPAWLTAGLEAATRAKLPPWLDPAELPPFVVDGARLSADDVVALIKALTVLAVDEPAPAWIADLRAQADADRADAFAWALFEAWLAGGAPPKGRWAMLSVGHLGTDRSATRLAPMIRAWPGESQHQRAVVGLSVLQAIGTDHALMLLNGIAQKVKFKALKERAREAMNDIAARKGMTREELEDRIVPDCGLDADGRRTFDYGPRQFEFVLGEGMKPMVRDGSGKVRASPPKPGARDDGALAERAREEWKLVRKQIADVAKIQADRLESAMVTGRRWTAGEFRAYLVDHPLQRHLTRLLVLGAWHGDDGPRTFRLSEEGDLADADDAPFALDDDAEVTIVHPLQLGEAERAAWGELLADYEIVPPFPQLGRTVYDVEPAELDQHDITRFAAHKVPPTTLVGILERTGWSRGPALDGGLFHVHTRYFRHADISVVVSYDGIPMGYMVDWEDQAVEHCYAVKGESAAEWDYDLRRGRALRWREVDPIVRSEALRTVHAIVARAR